MATDARIGVGTNGPLAREEFAKDERTGLRAPVFGNSRAHGATAVRPMHDDAAHGTAIPARTIIAGTVVTRDDGKGPCAARR